jgi:pyruvate/2-oxoglutarate dehydrogenase complex dihydrolipoamide acyltransferase (E2) component
MTAPPLDRTRLAKLLGMMGSTHPGEAINASRLANNLVREAGMSWEDILGKPTNGAEKTYTQDDLRYAYEKGRKEGAEQERARIPQSNAAAFQRTNRQGQEWRDFAKEALELNNASGRVGLSPIEIDVLTKFLNGGWQKPTPRQIETFFTKISNKTNLELPE